MAYATTDDVLRGIEAEAVSDLTNDSNPPAELDSGVLDALIEEADSLIDGKIGSRYVVPLATVPAMIRRFSVSITKYYLHTRRIWTKDERITDEYENVLALLDEIRDGKMDVPGATLAASVRGWFSADEQAYTSDTMTGF